MAQVETLMESDMLSTLKRVSPMPLLFQIDQIEIFKKNLFEENRTRLLRKKNIEKLKARPTMNSLIRGSSDNE